MFLKMRNCPIPYNLPNSDTDLTLPKSKTELKKKSFSYNGASKLGHQNELLYDVLHVIKDLYFF